MSHLKPKQATKEEINNYLVSSHSAYISEVKPFGNGANIGSFKQYKGKKALVIIRQDEETKDK